MITVFRKIRKSLVNDQSVSRYFFYAIGEILLVVIGILLALQVNNWNISRIEREKEALYLVNLKRDLNKQKEAIQYNIDGEQYVLNSLTDALESYDAHNGFIISTESMINIAPINDRYTFTVIDATYREMLSTGGLDILSDVELKNQLVEYYSTLELTERIIQNNNNHKDNTISLKSLEIIEVIGPNIVKMEEPTLRTSFDGYQSPDHILGLVKKVLQKPENELALLNSIRYRRNITYWHIKKLTASLEQTQLLISLIND